MLWPYVHGIILPPLGTDLVYFAFLCVLVTATDRKKKIEAESQPAQILAPGLAGRHKNACFVQFFMGSGPDLVEHRTL